jgi:hypothetical protein
MTVQWVYFPKSSKPSIKSVEVVGAFQSVETLMDSSKYDHPSNTVLALVRTRLQDIGFLVEAGKSHGDRIQVPVLFGLNGRLEKSFDADAYHEDEGFVIEVEAGRAVVNYQFLKDFFQACMMNDVNYLAIAVRNTYRNRKDFEIVTRFFETLYASSRLAVPLQGILVIGY